MRVQTYSFILSVSQGKRTSCGTIFSMLNKLLIIHNTTDNLNKKGKGNGAC